MKRKVIVSCILILVLCVSILVACQTDVDTYTLDDVLDEIKRDHNGIDTSANFNVKGMYDTTDSKGNPIVVYVSWTAYGSRNVQVGSLDEQTTLINVSVPAGVSEAFTLIATLTNKNGKAYTDEKGAEFTISFQGSTTGTLTTGGAAGGTTGGGTTGGGTTGGGNDQQQGGGSGATGSGTQSSPYTVAQALANTPSSGSSSEVYVKGVVSQMGTPGSKGDLVFYIVDAGSSDSLYVYFATPTAAGSSNLAVGDTVVVKGVLTTYNGKKEMTNVKDGITCEIVSYTKGTGGGQQQGSGSTDVQGTLVGELNLVGITTRISFNDTQIVHSYNGITYTYNKGKATTDNIDNTNNLNWATRAYTDGTITISYTSAIKSIVIVCDGETYNGKTYTDGMKGMTVPGATISVSGATTTVVLNPASTTFTTGALLSQMRILSIKIYA